ncbi:potassium transporter [Segetibacter sp. 3557_3]|uniref:monovalent cation:proton antiporter-2 (CPA2) family protein n=1 Tax=Segetibacter sp. 3557_3 TaxID=2547429 RepID=UPI001058BD30|nr:monovalent cation:proton antiporter-2 (CPA2) family protein [Segetibacter sp. 3557_3]TDH27401.1 potassium transporter [Segetibacter sp. 3557_3]
MNQQQFFIQAVIYLAAAVICVPLAKKVGLGSVLGYLLAGVIIGPAVLGIAGHGGEDLMHYAEFGVVMMLFVIGLELEPALLWRLRVAILGLGGLQMVITTALIMTACIFFGFSLKTSLAIGLILSLSSTAIVLQSFTEKGLMKAEAGQSAFSVLLFQDIAVIPILAIFPLLAVFPIVADPETHSGTLTADQPGWVQALIVLASVVAIIIGGRYIVRYFFRLLAKTGQREIFTAGALLLVVAVTVLMMKVGLSPALGTFLAGVVLADSEYRHELESDIEPFKGLLLGLFFVAVGVSIDFTIVQQTPLLIFSLVGTLMLLKGGVLFLLGKIFRLKHDQNLLFAFGLSQVGEFAFVLLSSSVKGGVLPKGEVDIITVVVAISMVFTPILLLINEKFFQPATGTRQAADKVMDTVDERNPVIIAGFGRFGNIVGRFLKANGVDSTVLEIDSDRVDLLRRFGYKVYYGDATRYDLLHSAGAADARLLIVAIGDPEKALELVDTAKKHFPNLRLLVRAYDRPDTFKFMDAGMLHIYRETIDTSLRMGIDALQLLGRRKYQAHRAARLFLRHDEKALKQLSAVRDDSKAYITTAREFIDELEQMIKSDINEGKKFQNDFGWDEASMIKEVNENGHGKQPS